MKRQMIVPDTVLKCEDFGVTIHEKGVRIKTWAPCAIRVRIALYETGDDLFREELPMEKLKDGIFKIELPLKYVNYYYTYILTCAETDYEVVDPYAHSAGPNSQKAMIIDLKASNPEGWEKHRIPDAIPQHEAIIYEVHVRDFSANKCAGIKNRGKYLAFTERGTGCDKTPTGLDHLIELGITHVHLMPVSDYQTVDEYTSRNYNWGYDPVLFNVPEGSYCTDIHDGYARVRELKSAIMAMHEAGIRVVLDVVYNHTYESVHSNLNRIAPGYFYRHNADGSLSNGSGCGNELATERPAVRKFILDSLKYWLTEYKVDGFRFDLLGLYDVQTVKEIASELRAMRPDIILYGEPWVGGDSALPEADRFLKTKQVGLGVGLFNDDFRNAIKGDNDGVGRGFAFGLTDMKPWVELGIVASTEMKDGRKGFATSAEEVVNYASAHDNLVLWDKIEKTCGIYSENEKLAMHSLSLAIVLTSFGMTFIQAGTEFVRTKLGHHNSYNAGDDINMLDWRHKHEYIEHYEYIRGLIAFRRESDFFKWRTQKEIRDHVVFYKAPEGCILYEITGRGGKRCVIAHNGIPVSQEIHCPDGSYRIVAESGSYYGEKGAMLEIAGKDHIAVAPYTSLILEGVLPQA